MYKIDTKGNQVASLEWDQSQTYYEHLLKDVLSTNSINLEGYPDRVQRNLVLNQKPKITIEEIKVSPEEKITQRRERRATKSLDTFKEADKLLTTSDLLKSKIQSGEIKQNCK